MRHPFVGIVEPARKSEITAPTRRSLFGLVAGAIGGTVDLIAFGTNQADARRFPPQQPTTLMLGEEGGRPPRPPGSRSATRARGEEGTRGVWKK